jgi:CheY-like chemotaxis protein
MKPRILVIEDQAQTRQLARWTLEPEGFEVCRCLKADPDLRRIPVVLLTSLVRDRDREREAGHRARAAAPLAKPFVPLELADVVVHPLEALGVPE